MLRSQVIKTTGENRQCYWNEDIFIPTSLPCVKGKLEVKCFDFDTAGKNDFIGQVNFEFGKIKEGKLAKYIWYNLYGAHGDLDNNEA